MNSIELENSAIEHGKGHEFKKEVKKILKLQQQGKIISTSMDKIYEKAYQKVMNI
jgi:hypothetical protein